MADNNRPNRKKVKSVLNYDPLAWLDEGEDEEAEAENQQTTSVKKAANRKVTAKKTVVKKKAVLKKSIKKKAVRKTTARAKPKLQNENPTVKSSQVSEDMSTSIDDSSAYGFFDTPDSADEKSSPHSQEAAESEAFGFFNEEVESGKVEDEAEQGFGFFDTADQLSSQSIHQDSATNIINLGAELTIRSVSDCKQLIHENMVNGFDIKLAAADLQKIDTAGIQLLYSLHKTLEKTSQTINWVNSNSIINDTCQLLGVPKLLETSEDEGSFGFF